MFKREMKYVVIERFRGRTLAGVKSYLPGEKFELPEDKAKRAIELKKIRPLDTVMRQRYKDHINFLKHMPSIKGTEAHEAIMKLLSVLDSQKDNYKSWSATLSAIEELYQEALILQFKKKDKVYCYYKSCFLTRSQVTECNEQRNCVECRLLTR